MKKLNLLSAFLLSITVALLLNSCNSYQPGGDKEIFVLEEIEIDTTLFDIPDSKYEQTDTMRLLGKGSTWKTWRKLHKECMKSDWFKNPYYFGVSSTVNLGAVVDEKFDPQRKMNEVSGFSEEELTKIINYGSYASCGFYQEMTMSLNVFLQSEFDFIQTGSPDLYAELQTAISKSRKTKVKIDYWRVNNLFEGYLRDNLKDTKDSDIRKKRYFESLMEPGHYILVKVIEIKGFTSKIELTTKISAELEAKLKDGVTTTMGEAGAEVKFKFINKTTIEVKSNGSFYVFGEFKKAIKVV